MKENSKTLLVVFISLLLDLLAFTMILPLFPALLDHYKRVDNGEGLYSLFLKTVYSVRTFIQAPEKVDSVLLGGMFLVYF